MSIILDGTAGITTPPIVLDSTVLGTAIAGELEYDGKVPYFTPQGSQRGVVPGMQYYRLNTALTGTNASGNQTLFGVGVTLSSNTVYAFESFNIIIKTAGTTSHNLTYLFGGTSTVTNMLSYGHYTNGGVAVTNPNLGTATHAIASSNSTTSLSTSSLNITTAGITFLQRISGTMSIGTGGTLIPQYNLSAAPGGAYTTQIGSWFLIYPIGAAGSNVSVGTWA
jgi:hypothetical protein